MLELDDNQLTFEFYNSEIYNADNLFISSSNRSAYNLIKAWPNWSSPCAAIIGPKGSGKTHFAYVWQEMSNAYLADLNNLFAAGIALQAGHNILLEDLAPDNFEPKQLFHLLNNLKQARIHYPELTMLITAQTNIDLWHINLQDLASRLRTIVKVNLEQPDEELLAAVLLKLFTDRQIIVDYGLIKYCLSRMERSLDFAVRLVDLCDKKSLVKDVKITKNIVGEALNKLLTY